MHANIVDGAIQRFHHSAGRYPESLAELKPWHLPFLPQPVMFRGQGWCYEGGADFYRLGYLYSQYFIPQAEDISITVHSAAGTPPEPGWACDQALADLRSSRP